MPWHEKHLSTSIPPKAMTCRSMPHLGQCMKWRSLAFFLSAAAMALTRWSASLRFFSASSRAMYSSSEFDGLFVVATGLSSTVRLLLAQLLDHALGDIGLRAVGQDIEVGTVVLHGVAFHTLHT